MLGLIWQFFVAILDWRLFFRRKFEVVFITNIRDEIDKNRFLGSRVPRLGHFNGPRYWFRGVSGRTRAIFSLTEDIMKHRTQAVAKTQATQAIEYVNARGAKVVLLAASTKRLFGEDGAELKTMFPSLVFTIGDNGTFFLLLSEVLRAFSKAGIKEGDRVCVICPYGFLGSLMTQYLTARKYKIVGLGSSLSRLLKSKEEYGIEIATSFDDVGRVDAVIACSHSAAVRLNADNIEKIRNRNRKLLVVDVAEPSNMTKQEYLKVKDFVVRQDAGNGYSPFLKYVLGFVTYRMFRLTRGVAFGCFMEALAIGKALKDNPSNDVKSLNLFEVNDQNLNVISNLFDKYEIMVPDPRCFGKKVKSFDLDLNSKLPETEVLIEDEEYVSV